MTSPENPNESIDTLPPIRRPILFYATVTIAFSLLGLSVLVLLA
ncbi:hypothetical protein AB6B39_14460 [Algimonas porphyrae]|nr:hypothetical protein [Algimonas porphyrae]